MSIDTSGPAFPIPVQPDEGREDYTGMTLRDYFAAKAMESFLHCDVENEFGADALARAAYDMADAMLKAGGLHGQC